MKKFHALSILLAGLLLLSACSVRSDAAELYAQEAPIGAEIKLPETISANDKITVQAVLTQDGKKLEEADFVHFEIWKQDGSARYPMQEAADIGDGVYRLTASFANDGLYYIEVHAGNKGALISPQKQFVVGELSNSDLEALKQGPQKSEGTSGHHH
ncbi:FixH family protein [Planomicrobium sp. CPCC 101110]|uniref:FixH family protein n=1 Tax=Planomicrobium sp. CPCC 101110 TaxID=2599619 RepID=UPI0011B83351|nr:FixH family protein [Planomicrobium sp. CPCC 101110]TWT27082.1 FixH family protein [Planomicrobium sp. CPCC 101110]